MGELWYWMVVKWCWRHAAVSSDVVFFRSHVLAPSIDSVESCI